MSSKIDALLDLLKPDHVNKAVLMPHDLARESFRLDTVVVADHQAFVRRIEEYVQHHYSCVGNTNCSVDLAFGEAKRILNGVFGEDPYQEGYSVALAMGLSGAGGGMRAIFNALADQLKRQALQNYKERVFNLYVDIFSPTDNEALAREYFARFGPVIRRFAPNVNEKTFASNVRAAVEYHLQIVEEIIRVARKM